MHHRPAKRAVDFSAGAATYDAGNKGKIADRYYRALYKVAGPALRPGMGVLDVGCGTGRLLAELERRYKICGVGVDTSAAMVQVAQAACPDMVILEGSCGALPVADASMDRVVACLAYHHFDDPAGFAAEARRVLKPGGRIYLSEPAIPGAIRWPINGLFHLGGFGERLRGPRGLVKELQAFGLRAWVLYERGLVCVVAASAAP